MRARARVLLAAAALLALGASPASRSAQAMAGAAGRLLASLASEQRSRASFSLDHAERFDWHFVPRSREGIPLGELTPAQRALAESLLRAGLGPRGHAKAMKILQLEEVLREEQGAFRDPGRYFFTFFGSLPSISSASSASPWGWRFEGHHLSLNYTVVENEVATSPAFFGADPAEVRSGPRKGLRPLAGEEDKGRALLRSLDPAQRRVAVFDDVAPRDIVTGSRRKVEPLAPAGLAASRLNAAQNALLLELLDEYLSRMPADLAAERLRELREGGLERIHFAWAGGSEPGQPQYYRLQGPSFLVEYDNTQDGANHIHTVWRDFDGDFGEDLLREHYRRAAHGRHTDKRFQETTSE